MTGIAAMAAIYSSGRLTLPVADRACLRGAMFILFRYRDAFRFQLVVQVFVLFAEGPLAHSLIVLPGTHPLSILTPLSGGTAPLDAFHITDRDLFHLVFQAPLHKCASRLVQDIPNLAFTLGEHKREGPAVLFPLTAAFFTPDIRR